MRRVKVWDLPTRAVHWALAALFAFTWLTAEDEGSLYVLHTYGGYSVLLLLLFRFGWGVAGNEHARFRNFVRPWAEVRSHLIRLLKFSPPTFVGHNPLGGWMVVALLLMLWAVVLTGLLAAGGQPGALLGPFVPDFASRMFEEIHEGVANFMLLLVLLHVFAVVMDWLLTGDNLIAAMVTGVKKVEDDDEAADVADARPGNLTLGILLVLGCLVVGYVLVRFTGF